MRLRPSNNILKYLYSSNVLQLCQVVDGSVSRLVAFPENDSTY